MEKSSLIESLDNLLFISKMFDFCFNLKQYLLLEQRCKQYPTFTFSHLADFFFQLGSVMIAKQGMNHD